LEKDEKTRLKTSKPLILRGFSGLS